MSGKDRLVAINRRVRELDAAIAAVRAEKVLDLRRIGELRGERELQWRAMQALVSAALGS